MVMSWWDSINHVVPYADMLATLRQYCSGSGGTGVMDTVIVAAIFWFGLGRR